MVVPGQATGTYLVNADGTGSGDVTITLPDASTMTAAFTFVITEIMSDGDSNDNEQTDTEALELFVIADELDLLTGNLDVLVMKKR